ncbi:hypothetical protein ACSLGG_01940 [Bacillus mycoides]|uniref:hypothetical protein n=1 Tax=Bacillus mycoides TaxID=1405 RepID=UPI003F755051
MNEQIDFKIVIHGRCNADNQDAIERFYDMLIDYAYENRDTGIINIRKDVGESSIVEAQEQGELKTNLITLDEGIAQIAKDVYKKMEKESEQRILESVRKELAQSQRRGR